MDVESNKTVEISFKVKGAQLPLQHGYSLYAAIKAAHGQPSGKVQFSPISNLINAGLYYAISDCSLFRVRCPVEQLHQWHQLSGNKYQVGQRGSIKLLSPRISIPQPAPKLYSPFVSFHLKQTKKNPEFYFLQSVLKAVDNLGVYAETSIKPVPRLLSLKEQNIVGFAVELEGLTEKDSLKVLLGGMGGRRHFGCGWFYGVRGCG